MILTQKLSRNISLLFAAALLSSPLDAADSRLGVMTHFAHGWDAVWVDIAAMRGITTVRDELYWNAVEPRKDVYSFPATFDRYMAELRRQNISPLITLSFENDNYNAGMTPYTDEAFSAFSRYGVEVLKHYGNQIKFVEVWNEYNGGFCKGPATDDRAGTYGRMLRTAYAQMKSVRPDVTVLGGGTIGTPLPYWEKLMQGGALASMDALSVHPYRYDQPPEGIEDEIAALQTLVRKYNNGASKPIWVTEIGWGIQAATAPGALTIDEAVQAKFLVRGCALLLSAGVERVYWYLLRDYEDFTLGLTYPDARPKLAAFAMQTMIRELDGAPFVRREQSAPGIYSLLFVRASGEEVRVLWSLQPTKVATAGATQIVGTTGNSVAISGELTLTDAPVFVKGAFRGLPPSPVSSETVVTGAKAGFSGQQGANGWSYGTFLNRTTTFEPLPNYTVSDWYAAWTGPYAYASVSDGALHPSATWDGKPVTSVRRWTSDRTGTLRVAGTFRCTTEGDGVGVSVLVDGVPLFRELLGGGRTVVKDFDLQIPVVPGTRLDFAVDPGSGANINFDATQASATISERTNGSSSSSTAASTSTPTSSSTPTSTSTTTSTSTSTSTSSNVDVTTDIAGNISAERLLAGADALFSLSGGYRGLSAISGEQSPDVTASGAALPAVRRWVSDRLGTVRVRGSFQCSTQGDGVGVGILRDGGWLFHTLLGNGGATLKTFDFTLPVVPGTLLDFAVDAGAGNNIDHDATTVMLTITAGG